MDARWFVDATSPGVAAALARVRDDVTWPGGPGAPVAAGAGDAEWVAAVGAAGLVVLSRGRRLRGRPVERRVLLAAGVRACVLTATADLDPFAQLRAWLRAWDRIEALVRDVDGPWIATVGPAGVRLLDGGQYAQG